MVQTTPLFWQKFITRERNNIFYLSAACFVFLLANRLFFTGIICGNSLNTLEKV